MRYRDVKPDRDLAKAVIELGELVMKLGTVERVTYHPGGRRHETDTTHTVMLGIIAPALAAELAPGLNRGLIAEFANFHDLPEALVGDVDSFQAAPHELETKKVRELMAARQIERQFADSLSYVTVRMRQYQEQRSPEARWVWAVDKLMPALTHILNGGVYLLKDAQATPMDLAMFNARETARMEAKIGEFYDMRGLLDLYAIMKGMLFEYVYGTEVPA